MKQAILETAGRTFVTADTHFGQTDACASFVRSKTPLACRTRSWLASMPSWAPTICCFTSGTSSVIKVRQRKKLDSPYRSETDSTLAGSSSSAETTTPIDRDIGKSSMRSMNCWSFASAVISIVSPAATIQCGLGVGIGTAHSTSTVIPTVDSKRPDGLRTLASIAGATGQSFSMISSRCC